MCQFGNESKILKTETLIREEAIIGFRDWRIINNKLSSLSRDFIWEPNTIISGEGLLGSNSLGIYNYNNNYNNYNYNNNNNNNYYNYYYYNYYYNYYGKTLNWGKIIHYEEGFRAEYSLPTHVAKIEYEDSFNKSFINQFNSVIDNLSKDYNLKIVNNIKDLEY